MKRFLQTNSLIIFILLIASLFRVYGLNWDQGYHLHPDERAIVMFTTPLQFPKTISEFFSPTSSWNPHFFAYGSFPIYFLKTVGNVMSNIDPAYATYDRINLLGRFLSAMFDIGTLLTLFLLAKKIFNKNIGLIATFFYTISVLPIQLSHFYAVDTPLTFFVLLTLYRLIQFYEHSTLKNAFLVGIFFGLSLATKTSALVLIASISMAITVDFLLIFLRNPHRPHIWLPHFPKFLKRLIVDGIIIVIVTIITFVFFEPYALIDFQTFWQQQLQQRQMTYDAFTFPYTLQYVGKIPYLYELRNIFLFGLGPILATLLFLGAIYVSLKNVILVSRNEVKTHPESDSGQARMTTKHSLIIILLSFFWTYFLIVGNFAIGFMRYMLPLYPFLCLFAAVFLYRLLSSRTRFGISLMTIIGILLLIWPTMFLHIYSKPNTRVLATDWINKNIPPGSTLATEHWDDGLPLNTQGNYKMLELPMYESDTPAKWDKINQVLKETQYIIIASNRLYVPLMKMTNCQKLPVGRCYTQTAEYYRRLFNNENVILPFHSVIPSEAEGSHPSAVDARDSSVVSLPQNDIKKDIHFQKVAEFSVIPQFSILNSQFSIDDSSADESFTVYDHPKVMIFKKIL